MFDLRYHVASLAAVFVALIIGILRPLQLLDPRLRRVEVALQIVVMRVLDSAQARINQLKRTEDAFQQGYPALMAGRLAGKQIAILFIGPVDTGISSDIEQTLEDAGGPPPLRLRAVDVPINPLDLDKLLGGRPALAQYVGDDKLTALGQVLGREFALGGSAPLWKVLASRLVEERSGPLKPRADGIVVVRSVKPQQGATARFLAGVFAG